ncbi:hypothetical protein GCM10028796_46800 [Ramlibacter monticola]|uniref:Phage major capsid protein n=1 Tax=Ramlibacter monticola TaxID=1926872 RepID=A0A937CV51_9BURK|nr:phage major capsid protein [Ramlibacter monticola]MBL0394305.1 phage major capsid protein [Ramlibacter monticola]
MAFPNVSDIVATTIENRSRRIADNVEKNNALLRRLQQRGNVRTIDGGSLIYEELSFAENSNAGWYSGYDLLPVAAQDVISAAQYDLKQAACPVTISGLDQLKNSGKEQFINLLEGRMGVAESSMQNLLAAGVYSDGTGAGGKQITGLNAAVPVNPATGTYGGIDRSTAIGTFWRSKTTTAGAALTAATIQGAFNDMWSSLVRGMDRPDLIVVDNFMWGLYLASLQAQQRFTGTETAKLGFPTVQYMDADVVLDGGIGGFMTTKTAFFLNTKFLFWRPHAQRNMVPLSPDRRYAINQDASVSILAFCGQMTCSGAQFQGRLISP